MPHRPEPPHGRHRCARAAPPHRAFGRRRDVAAGLRRSGAIGGRGVRPRQRLQRHDVSQRAAAPGRGPSHPGPRPAWPRREPPAGRSRRPAELGRACARPLGAAAGAGGPPAGGGGAFDGGDLDPPGLGTGARAGAGAGAVRAGDPEPAARADRAGAGRTGAGQARGPALQGRARSPPALRRPGGGARRLSRARRVQDLAGGVARRLCGRRLPPGGGRRRAGVRAGMGGGELHRPGARHPWGATKGGRACAHPEGRPRLHLRAHPLAPGRSSVETVAGAGHFLPLERPELVREALLDACG